VSRRDLIGRTISIEIKQNNDLVCCNTCSFGGREQTLRSEYPQSFFALQGATEAE
jgi:hypothetical protein